MPTPLFRDRDGRSVWARPGTTRYALRSGLTEEERKCQAQRTAAPVPAHEFCAAQLGVDADALETQLVARQLWPEYNEVRARKGRLE